MASEKITMYRTNEDQTVVIEQLPKTVTSQVYDSENEQFLDTTIEDINTEITEHKQQKGQPNGYASLDANGKVPSSQISISGGGVVEDASTTQKGIVKLNTSTNSTSTTEAATPSSVKAAYDLANSKYTKPQTGIPSSDLTSDVQATLNKVVDGTTSTKGLVQLTNSTTSTSTTTAATPNSVKTVNDTLTTHNNDYMKHGISGTTTGSANTYNLTLSPALTAYTKGLTVTIFVNVANTGGSTLNINGLGAKILKKNTGSGFISGDLGLNIPYTFVYNGTDFVLTGAVSSNFGVITTTEVLDELNDQYLSDTLANIVNDVAAHGNDYMKHGITGTTTGSANTYVLTPSPALSTYTKGIRITLFVNVANTGSSTINISGLGTKTLKKNDGSTYASGELKINTPYTFVYNGADFLADSLGGGGISEEVIVNYVDYYTELSNVFKTDNAQSLTVAREYVASTTVENYTLIGGGNTSNSESSVVDAYNSSLVRTTPTALSVPRTDSSATTVGNYALFAGGGTLTSPNLTVDAYNSSLVRTIVTSLSVGRAGPEATTIGNYALIAGGANTETIYANVDAYNSSLVRTTPTALSQGRAYLSATTAGNYALFGGGAYYISGGIAFSDIVDIYDSSLTRYLGTNLDIGRYDLVATSVGNYSLFAGGLNGQGELTTTDVYDINALVKQTSVQLSLARRELAATSLNDYALFAGGQYLDENPVGNVDTFDKNLIRIPVSVLATPRYRLTASRIGNFALFSGGSAIGGLINTVEVFTNSFDTTIDITAGSIYKFNSDTTEQTAATNITLSYTDKVTGYVKMKSGTLTK